MRHSTKILHATAVALMLLGIVGVAQADSAIAYVGTVNGIGAFDIQNSGSQIYFHPQPDTNYVWMENNGSPAGTVATYTYNGVTANRDGMKTFACTDIAYGQRLDSIKLEFDCYTGTDTATGFAMIQPGINVQLTDGDGHYACWSPGTGGTPYTLTPITGEPGWNHLVLDCTNLEEKTWGQMNEYNSGSELTTKQPLWSVIRDWTVAGFYDFLRAPQGGFEAWNETLFSDITNVGVPSDPTLNEYGIVLFHGDTVGGMYGDGCGEIGAAAERPWSQGGRMARNLVVTVGGTAYDMTFAPGVVPEPGSLTLLIAAVIGTLAYARLRRRS